VARGGFLARKALHTAVGVLAFAVPLLGAAGTLALALFLVAWNLWVLPRISWLWRPGELRRGAGSGIVLYPVAILILTLLFPHRLEVVAACWGILAFGDGVAALAGVAWSGARLPWNREKSWAGTVAGAVAGTVAAAVLLAWSLEQLERAVPPFPHLAAIAAGAGLFAAWLESQPQGLDDNLRVPIPTALLLSGLLATYPWTASLDAGGVAAAFVAGAAVNLALAAVAVAARSVTPSGAVAGWLLGTAVYTFQGWRGFLLLLAFVVLGSAATRLGYGHKARSGVAQEAGGRRSARHAVANLGVAAVAAFLAAATLHPAPYLAAFAAALATALGDTLSSEVGQLLALRGSRWGRPVRITDGRPVRPGLDGGVSLAGSVAGVAGSLLVAAIGLATGLLPATVAAVVAGAGCLGNAADSLLGATVERRGLLDNQGVNFAATLVGSVAAALAVGWLE